MADQESEAGVIDLGQTWPTAEERHRLIAEAAYYRAERRGFAPGAELQDWLEAEAEIAAAYRKLRPEARSIDA